MMWLFAGEADPPIPQGATKFSYSTRLGEVRVKLCDTDMDFLEIKVCVTMFINTLFLFVVHPKDPVLYVSQFFTGHVDGISVVGPTGSLFVSCLL
jgi:hypothetical protein